MALLTVLIVAVGAVRGYLAATESGRRYPCAFQQRENGRWVGKLSLADANHLRAVSVRRGEPEPVRLNDVTAADAPSMITCVAEAHGMDPGPFVAVAKCESGLNPANDTNPLYEGLFQYHPDTWAAESVAYGHKGASIFDGYAQINVTVQWVKDGGWGPWGRCI